MNFFNELQFRIARPKLILVTGRSNDAILRALRGLLVSRFKIGKDVIITSVDLTNQKTINFLFKNSSYPIFIANGIYESGDAVTEDKELHAVKDVAKALPQKGCLIYNSDDEISRSLKSVTLAVSYGFGLQQGADLFASDIAANGGINFKMNYGGSSVPVWLEGNSGNEQIYAVLAAAIGALLLGLNLVEISQGLKSFKY